MLLKIGVEHMDHVAQRFEVESPVVDVVPKVAVEGNITEQEIHSVPLAFCRQHSRRGTVHLARGIDGVSCC